MYTQQSISKETEKQTFFVMQPKMVEMIH